MPEDFSSGEELLVWDTLNNLALTRSLNSGEPVKSRGSDFVGEESGLGAYKSNNTHSQDVGPWNTV